MPDDATSDELRLGGGDLRHDDGSYRWSEGKDW
jgi:hypothetical protein